MAGALDLGGLFGALSEQERTFVLEGARTVSFAGGDTPSVEGVPGDTAYLILTGRARVERRGRQVNEIEEGDFFGELSLVDRGPRSTTIVADGPMTCLELSSDSLWKLLRATPSVLERLLRSMAERLREAEQPLDRLTGLPNRGMFEELLSMAVERARANSAAIAVLSVNLDRFHLINESLGHTGGDQLLAQVAERVSSALAGEAVLGRPGGVEFLVLTPEVHSPDAALASAEGLTFAVNDALAMPFVIQGQEVFVTASVGVAAYPGYSEGPGTILRDAVTAMHQAKAEGPGGHVVYASGSEDAARMLTLATRLRRATAERRWTMLYQPIVELGSGEIVGVEALIRWDEPDVPGPAKFIPLAEDLGLIGEIGDWVVSDVCRQAAEWRDAGVDLYISFNLSPRELWQGDIITRIIGGLAQRNLTPDCIVAEVTETSALTDPERTQAVLEGLSSRGIRLSLDDFGTGFSSLSRLKDMPVSTLKIDRSFVMDLPGSEDAGKVVRAVIWLAYGLGLTSLAEGIETPEQRAFLLGQGCSLGQGFLFSPPVTAPEIEALLAQKSW